MLEFLENIFDDWDAQTYLVAFILMAIPLYIAWFVNIPSAMGDSSGINLTTKIAITIVIPIAIIFFINKKK